MKKAVAIYVLGGALLTGCSWVGDNQTVKVDNQEPGVSALDANSLKKVPIEKFDFRRTIMLLYWKKKLTACDGSCIY